MRRRALLMGGKQQKPLIIRVSTSLSGLTPSDTFRIPANAPGETYDFTVDWGDGIVTSNHTSTTEHTYSSPGVKDIKIYGKFPRMFFNNMGDRRKLMGILDWGDIEYSTNQERAFFGCEFLSFIAEDANGWYNGITSGTDMFRVTSVTTLPNNMTLSSLEGGSRMFLGTPISSAIGLKLYNINSGSNFMSGANLPSSQYSNILMEIESNNLNDNVRIHFGSSKYNTTGRDARDMLLRRGWNITDGGLE